MSDSNYTNLGYVEETTFGTTPSANLQLLRRTGDSLAPRRTTVTSEEIRSDLRAGKPVRTTEMGGGDIQLEWSYTTLEDMLEGVLMEAWDSTVLVDGTTKKSYTFEKQYVDPDISPFQYLIFKGSRISSLSLSLALGAIARGSVGIMAATPSIAQASAGTGNTAVTTTGPINTVDMVTSIGEGASPTPVSTSRIIGLDINLQRNLRAQHEIGALAAFGIGVGRLLVTGRIQQYFQDDQLMDAWFGFNDRAIEVELTDDASNVITITLPKLKWVGDPDVSVSGVDSDCYVSMDYEAYADAGDAALIQFVKSS